MKSKFILLGASALILTACGNADTAVKDTASDSAAKVVDMATDTMNKAQSQTLTEILNARPEDVKARYQYRNPKKTIEFFGIEPGMTVAEILPGGGWYTKILLPYVGDEGKLVGVDYSLKMWPEFGGFATEEFVEKKKSWPETWTKDAQGWRGDGKTEVSAFAFGQRPRELNKQVDAVLFIRALHNLARFDDEGGYLTEALKDTYAMLKPGGIVGVVQHRAPEGNPDDWADGNNGYLKESFVIAAMEKAGFKLAAQDEINANPKDKPTTKDMVWRLPPTLGTSSDKPELKAKLEAVGESDRMTLKFVKE